MASESISVILERTLDLINGNESGNAVAPTAEPSAASILLAEKRRMKEQAANMEQDFIPLSSSLGEMKPVNHLLDQISLSSIDQPTYWKGITQKPKKTAALPVMTNVKKASKLRGEAYQDKRQSKNVSKASRKDRMHRLKNLF